MNKSWSRRLGLWSHRFGLFFIVALPVLAGGCLGVAPSLRDIDSEATFIQGADLIRQNRITLSDLEDRSESFTVTGRTSQIRHTETVARGSSRFQQVANPETVTMDSFTQVDVPIAWNVVDILLMIDNSPSMADEQANLAANFSNFLSTIRGIDWRIAVITSDPAEYGTLRGMIVKDQFATPAAELAAFQSLIQVGVGGPVNERPILNTIGVLLDNPQNFIRPNAAFISIFVSDEDSCSNGYANMDPSPTIPRAGPIPLRCRDDWDAPSALLDVAEATKGDLNAAGFYGIFWVPGEPSQGSGTLYEANLLQAAVDGTGKFSRSIWSPDYGAVLRDIGQDIPDPRDTMFTLTDVPNGNSFTVRVNGTVVDPSLYRFGGNTLQFAANAIPPSRASITVDYTSGDTPVTSTTLTDDAIPSSIEVRVDGVVSSHFSYDQGTRRVTFTRVSPGDSVTTIDYSIVPTVFQKKFDLRTPAVALDSVEVSTDGRALASSDYFFQGGALYLRDSVAFYENIEINYVPQSTLSTKFELSAAPYGGVTLSSGSHNGKTGVSLDPASIRVGDRIDALYKVRVQDTRSFELDFAPMASSVVVYVDEEPLVSDLVSVDGLIVSIEESIHPQAEVIINYVEEAKLSKEFPVKQRRLKPIVQSVTINGIEAESGSWSYDSQRQMLVFEEPPPVLSVVKVTFE